MAAGTAALLGGRALERRVARWTAAPPAPARTACAGDEDAGARHGTVADPIADGAGGIVAVLAVATLGFWLGAGAGPAAALGAAAAVLLVACPAAAGDTAGTARRAATARAVELGARPTGPHVLERAARVDVVVLGPEAVGTGGTVTGVHPAPGVDPDVALRLAGAVADAAGAGADPAGAAVARAARARFGTLPGVAEADARPGRGVSGVVTELDTGPDGPRVLAHATLVGRPALLDEHGIALPPELAAAVRDAPAGATPVAVSWDGVARAVLVVADPPRPGATAAVRRLRALGVRPVLLGGDHPDAIRAPAAALGADPARELPAGATVAVLGAGADAPGADLVLAPDAGAGPEDGIALRDADPLTAVDALRVARRAARTVERVVTATLAYHLVALPLAAAGLLPPPAAAAAATVWPVVAVASAARLRRLRATPRPDGTVGGTVTGR